MKLRLLGFVATLAIAGSASWFGSGLWSHWTDARNSECRVWVGETGADDVNWSGDCVDGLGEGPGVLTTTTADGSIVRYEGVMSAGKFQDAGT